MQAADLATAGFIDQHMRYLHSLFGRVPGAAGASAAGSDVVLYSVQKLAQVLDVHPETVRLWLKKGKRGLNGHPLKLRAYYFTSEPRIPWPAVLAYHRGEDFDLDKLPAPVLLPPAELLPAPLPKLTTPDAPAILKVA